MKKQTKTIKKTVKSVNAGLKKSVSCQRTIIVKNAEGTPNTKATILIQNKIDYVPKVSVIIPVYNVAQYLRECLESVCNQTLKEIEIICVDDGSTDNSLEILKEYAKKDNRITVIAQENLYAGVARNAGLAVANGKYLSFLDSDDFFELNMLEEMYKTSNESDLDICICGVNAYSEKTKTFQPRDYFLRADCVYHKVFNKNNLQDNLYKFTCPAAWTKLYKRDFVLKNELFFQNLYSCNDIGMTFSALALADKMSIVNKVFVHYRVDSQGQITKKRGKTAINIIHAYYYIKHHLVKNKLEYLINCLDFQIMKNITFELSKCNFIEKTLFKRQTKRLMGKDFEVFQSCFKRSNFLIHFIQHMKQLHKSKHANLKIQDGYNQFMFHNIQDNSVLMVEANNYHGECLPGMAKYFLDLGYNVDVIMSSKEYFMNPFCNLKDNRIQLFCMDLQYIKQVLESDIIEKYEHLYFNSDRVFNADLKKVISYYSFFGKDLKLPEEKVITMVHGLDKYKENNFTHPAFYGITLSDLPVVKGTDLQIVNSHYFGEFINHEKNDIVKFVCVGNIESQRKNHSLLFDAIDYLVSKDITNFQIDVIARAGALEIPEKYKHFIQFKGRLDYPDMYNTVNNSDFFLTLLDPENPEHDRYITCGTSGSFQLIYGFNKPCLICSKFSTQANGLNSKNAILYDDNSNLGHAMQKAIEMTPGEYKKIQNNVKTLQQQIYKESLNNLKKLLKTDKCKFEKNTFISLGENCFVRTVLVRHHTKCKRSEGELSFPFDLKVCGIKTVIKLLETNFDKYFDGLSWNSKEKLWVNNELGIRYNHDIDCDTKEKLIARYTQRIKNMQELQNGKNLIFVASTVNPDTDVSDINKLFDVLNSIYKNIKFVFINISKSELQNIQNIDKHIFYKHIPHPYPNYWGEWYKEEFYNSKSGIDFEKEFNKYVRNVVGKK